MSSSARMKGVLAVAAACAGLGLAACGGDDNKSSDSAATNAPAATTAADSTASAPANVEQIDSAAAGKEAADKAGKPVDLPKKTVGFLDVVGGIDSTIRLRRAAEDAAKKLNWKMIYCDGAGQQDKSAACMSTLLSRNVDAIMSDGTIPSFIATGLRQAKQRGIPTVVVGGDLPVYDGNYGPDEAKKADVLVDYFKQTLGKLDMSPVPIAVNQYPAPWAQTRTKELKKMVDGDSKFKIVATTEPDQANLIDGSRKATMDQLTAHPDIKAFWVDFDAVGQAVGQTVSARFRDKSFPDKPLVATFHADPGSVKLIRQGAIDAVAENNYEAGSYIGFDQLAEYFARKTPLSKDKQPSYGGEAGDLYTYQLVTKDNLPADGELVPGRVDVPEFFKTKWSAEFRTK